VDAAKVTRSALEKRPRSPRWFYDRDLITDIPEKKESAGGGHNHGGGDMDF